MQTELKVSANGQEFPVSIDDDGMFAINMGVVDGTSAIVRASSFAELQRKARKIKTRFELPFTRVSPEGVVSGTVTGIHATNGNLLVKWDNGQSEQVPVWSGTTASTMPRLSDEDAAEAKSLVKARNDAVRALDRFIKERQFESLKKAAEKAQKEAAGQ